ncbi:MAG: DUF2267 domain-containing protein [Beijerinckiaceae bacterium]|jgi:hypothetical protein|nr:DUF2267 domain-containing protein [Beijerinckiaceae bacterium]
MQDIIDRIATAAGIDPDTAAKAIGIILGFLQKEGPSEQVGQLIGSIPGASELVAAHADEGGGGIGGLMGMMGGGGGLMALAGKLTGIGLGMGEMQSVGKELFQVGRETAGEDTVGEIAGSIPGLSQFT